MSSNSSDSGNGTSIASSLARLAIKSKASTMSSSIPVSVTASEQAQPAADGAVSTSGTGVGAPGALMIPLSGYTGPLRSDTSGLTYSIRQHPQAIAALALFSVVEIVSVKMYVHQIFVHDAGERVGLVRFGVAPRGTTTTDPNTQNSVAHVIPRLQTMALSSSVPSVSEVTFGQGGVSFPPGLQLDLRAAETRHNYAQILLTNITIGPQANARDVVGCQFDVMLACSGQNFGAIF